MKPIAKTILPLLAVLALSGCTGSNNSAVSSILSSSSADSSSSSGAVVADQIVVSDNIGSYTVGETFGSLFDLKVVLHYSDGSTKDVSSKSVYYKTVVKDSSGNVFDTSKPFTTAGNYTLQAYYKSNPKIISDPVTIVVKPALTNVLTTKSAATASFDYSDVENSSLSNLSFPSHSDKTINTLVIPLEITDYPFSMSGHGDKYRDALNAVFNGNGEADTGYWESVSSYYRKSSMGKLNFNFEIAQTYQSGKTTNDLNEMYKTNASYYTAVKMVENAIANYKSVNGQDSTKKFDNDGDGYIDGLWVVYSAPDYAHSSTISAMTNKDIFWAFCTDTDENEPNVDSPTLHSFGWASETFMNEAVAAADGVDGHTFIHETGHLLSLPDYYSYDISSSSSSGCQGGLAMMDLNIGDQDAFSKMALGWADPYVVTDDCIVTINPNEATGDCILLADNWNGTPFDEYMLFDLQTPTGLNVQDSTKAYNYRPLYFNKPGVRAYHVDARLGELRYLYKGEESVGNEGAYWTRDDAAADYYVSDDVVKTLAAAGSLPRMSKDKTVSADKRNPGYNVINANCASRCGVSEKPETENRLLTIVTRDNVNCEADLKFASADSLFQPGDSWDMTRCGAKYFTTNPGNFNNGNHLNWVVTVLACDANSATLQFRKY